MCQGAPGDGGVSDETRMLAARVRQRAGSVPDATRIRTLADRALSEPREAMTAAEIRALAAEALAQAQQVSSLLLRLAALLGDGGDGDEH